MKITRNTFRADGLTVGQAMDRDAAFLRSIGIPAKDGALTYDELRDQFQDRVRNCVLKALDEEFVDYAPGNEVLDKELGLFFPGLDELAKALFNRLHLRL
jgi:hypothetical protein